MEFLRSLSWRWVTVYIPLLIFLFVLLFPFYWMVLTAFKPAAEVGVGVSGNPFWPSHFTLEHMKTLLFDTPFLTWLKNTAIVAVAATAISVVSSTLAAYAIERLRFPGSHKLGFSIFIAYLVPPSLLFLPLAGIVLGLGLYNTLGALIVVYPTLLIPFMTWLLMGFFRAIPYEIEECALVDGASRIQIFTKIILPLSVPGLVSAILFGFTLSWNEYLYALTYIFATDNKTVAVGVVTGIITGDVFHWGQLMSGALLGSLPVVILYSFFVEYYVSGMTGSVKG